MQVTQSSGECTCYFTTFRLKAQFRHAKNLAFEQVLKSILDFCIFILV